MLLQNKLSRRQFFTFSTAGLASSYLTGCASSPKASTTPSRLKVADASQVEVLFYADTNAHWQASYAHPVANHLGPFSLLGYPPYLTEEVRLANLGFMGKQDAAPWLSTKAARQAPTLMGGYAALAHQLNTLKLQLGEAACLTLEGGGCWAGSGLASLSQGEFSPTSSHWLGAEAKVVSSEAQLWPKHYQNLYQQFNRPLVGANQAPAFFTKAGVKIAVVGSTNPWQANPQGFNPQLWLSQLQQQVNLAAKQASLVILLSDAGTNPNLWLAQNLQGVAAILSSGSQDLWPQPIVTRHLSKASIPLITTGTNGQGFMQLTLVANKANPLGWDITANYHPVLAQLSPEDPQVAAEINQLSAPFNSWLNFKLAEAPTWLYTQDCLTSSWGQLMAASLATQGASLSLTPGLRQGLALPPGASLTRNHLLSLTAGHTAKVFKLTTSQEEVKNSLEAAASQLLSDQLFLHTSEDMPRLGGASYLLRYQGLNGNKIGELSWPASATSSELSVNGWSKHYQGQGIEVWQLMESYLLAQKTSWQLPEAPTPSLAFVDGHPGWHPAALL